MFLRITEQEANILLTALDDYVREEESCQKELGDIGTEKKTIKNITQARALSIRIERTKNI